MKEYERGYLEIQLDTLLENVKQLKSNLSADTKVMPIIKADGYGHGAKPIARTLEEVEYVWGFGVATIWEAVALRKDGVQKPILLLGNFFRKEFELAIKYDVAIAVYTESMAIELNEIAKIEEKRIKIHIKIETGMSRLGIEYKNAIEVIQRIDTLEYCKVEAVLTHFAKADEVDKMDTYQQAKRFQQVLQGIEREGVPIKYVHCSNSAAAIDIPDLNYDLVRTGIAIYGLAPSQEVDKSQVILNPILSWKSKLSSIRTIEKGVAISYGGTFISKEKMTIGVVPMGYADGYPRSLSNVGSVLIGGKRAKILGRICMDQFMVDISKIENVEVEDDVVLVGKQGEETITIEELSELSQRFNYEFVCEINKRVPRVYIKNNKVIEQIDYFA